MKKVLLNMYLRKNLGDDIFLKIISERYPNTIFYSQPLCNYNNKEYNSNIKFIRNFITRLFNVAYKKTNIELFSITNKIKKKCNYQITLGGSMFIEKKDNKIKDKYKEYNSIKMPYFILGSNFGPYYSESYYNLYKEIFSNAEDVCFREKYSYDMFKGLKNVRHTKDIVFSLDTSNYNNVNNKKVVISVIDLDNRNDLIKYKKEYENKMIEIINYFIKKKYKVLLMSFCKAEGDESVIDRIYSELNSNLVSKYYYDGNIDEAINEIAESEYIIASRFHAMILGFIFNKKVLPLIYSKKMTNVIEDLKFNGIYYEINNIKNLNIEKDIRKIKKPNFDLEITKKEAEKHFEVLDKYIN